REIRRGDENSFAGDRWRHRAVHARVGHAAAPGLAEARRRGARQTGGLPRGRALLGTVRPADARIRPRVDAAETKETAMSARVLVVAADPRVAARIETTLEEARYDVRAVADEAAAMTSVGEWCPDLVIADYDMPQLDGPDLCRKIHSASPIPIVVV